MKLLTKIICLIALLAIIAAVRAGTVDSNTFQSTYGLAFDMYPTNTPLILVQNPIPVGIPAINGTTYTNGNYASYLDACVVFTNSVSGYITNLTTKASYPFGAIANEGTNYETIFARLGPNEVYGIGTNNGTGIGVVYSEIRN